MNNKETLTRKANADMTSCAAHTMDGRSGKMDFCIWDGAEAFSEGLARVKKDGKWGFIDQSGKTLIPFIYEDATSVYDGLAWVKQEGFWGVLQVFDE